MICWGAPGIIPPAPGSWDHTNPLSYVDCLAYGTYAGPPNALTGTPTPLNADGHSLLRNPPSATHNNLNDFVCGDPATPERNDGMTANMTATTPCLPPPTTTTSSTTTTTTTTTTATTTTLCLLSPVGGCVGPGKGILLVKEKVSGKEKVKVVLKKLKSALSQGQFGNPVTGATSYSICIYDENDALVGEMEVDRAQANCGTPPRPCWKDLSGKGYKYKDKDTSADGIRKIITKGGDAGKGNVIVLGKNNASKGQVSLPTGIAAALQDNTEVTVQVVTSDADCFGVTADTVKKADGSMFKALGGSPSSAFFDAPGSVLD